VIGSASPASRANAPSRLIRRRAPGRRGDPAAHRASMRPCRLVAATQRTPNLVRLGRRRAGRLISRLASPPISSRYGRARRARRRRARRPRAWGPCVAPDRRTGSGAAERGSGRRGADLTPAVSVAHHHSPPYGAPIRCEAL